ncbi:MAG: HD domain-containing protein [Proteobacteria bacterium]|nr:HD domain-containing protein [Desulfobulbaceae bacterium]MBU4152994.1 HD domain-containing protein [Pseudomonadota bacterium]
MTSENETVIHSFRALHDLSKAINSTLEIDLVEEVLLQKTSQLMRSDKALLLLRNEEKQSLTIHKSFGFKSSELPANRFENIHLFDHCLVHKGSVITLEEVLSTPDRQLLHSTYPHLLEMIFAPLEIEGKASGLLGIVGSKINFSEIELEIFCSIGSQASVAMENASLHERLHSTFLHTAEALAEAINSRDPYTGGHTQRVSKYSLLLAESLNFSREEKTALHFSSILHDVGKIGIDDSILRKVGRLTAEEKRKMDDHPQIGAKILGYVEEMKEVIPGVLHHHEWFDGSGYPDGLSGDKIPLQARVIAIADAFDALTTNRPYRQASAGPDALDILELDGGSHFDPELLATFRTLQTFSKL